MSDLLEALGVNGGIVAAVGAGGKKSLLYAIAATAQGRIAWTATVHTAAPPRWTGMAMHVADTEALLATASKLRVDGVHGFARPSDKPARLAGLAPADVARLHAAGRFDLTLVKADGARMRGIKAPAPEEPVLPEATTRVLVVVSAAVIDRALDAHSVHRPERLASLLGITEGTRLTSAHVAALLAAADGGLQGTAGLPVVAVINQVDDAARRRQALVAARAALAASDRLDRVVLTCLHATRRNAPVVDVITRQTL